MKKKSIFKFLVIAILVIPCICLLSGCLSPEDSKELTVNEVNDLVERIMEQTNSKNFIKSSWTGNNYDVPTIYTVDRYYYKSDTTTVAWAVRDGNTTNCVITLDGVDYELNLTNKTYETSYTNGGLEFIELGWTYDDFILPRYSVSSFKQDNDKVTVSLAVKEGEGAIGDGYMKNCTIEVDSKTNLITKFAKSGPYNNYTLQFEVNYSYNENDMPNLEFLGGTLPTSLAELEAAGFASKA